MRVRTKMLTVAALCGCTAVAMAQAKVSILVDLDPASADRTYIVEALTADSQGRLYLPDRASNNILRVDPKAPKPVVVGRIETRQIDGKPVLPNAAGPAFDRDGNLYVAVGPYAEIVRIKKGDLDPAKPGVAETFATGVTGANGVVFDTQGNLFISGGITGKVYRVGSAGGAAQVAAEVEPFSRTFAVGGGEQANVANGIAFDSHGTLYFSDTARGAIWTTKIGADGKGTKPVMLVRDPLLEGGDGIAFDRSGRLWVAVNERNALVTVTADGKVQQVAKNGNVGPLEFPSALVFVGKTGYICNYDTPRGDNYAADGKTSIEGIGASIAQIQP